LGCFCRRKENDLASRGTREIQSFLGGQGSPQKNPKQNSAVLLKSFKSMKKSLQRQDQDRGTGFFGYFLAAKKYKDKPMKTDWKVLRTLNLLPY